MIFYGPKPRTPKRPKPKGGRRAMTDTLAASATRQAPALASL